MADPNPSIWNDDDSQEITAINFGTGDAGTFRTLEAGVEYHIWNDKGRVLTSSDMTSVKVTVRDDDGLEVENITIQKWVEVKSTTVHAGADGGSISGVSDDNMADFQPVGKEGYLNIGDIPCDCYRKVFFRINIPTSALEAGVTFKIYVTNQQPSSPIAKWITGLFGDGVVWTGDKLEVTDNAGADSKIDIAAGYALINDIEVYLSKAQTYTISTTDATYKIYLTRTGVISSTTGSIPSNSIQLATVVISGNVVDSVTDARTFIFHTLSRVICQHFQDLLVADTDGIHAAITGNGASQDITTGITNPDYARNISITTTNVATPSGNVTITGLVRGVSATDIIAISAGGTAYGVKAFDTITNINIPSGVSASDTVTVGFSDKIGLSNPILSTNNVFKKKVNNEDKTSELSGNVNATYNTVDCATIVANQDMEIRYTCVLTF